MTDGITHSRAGAASLVAEENTGVFGKIPDMDDLDQMPPGCAPGIHLWHFGTCFVPIYRSETRHSDRQALQGGKILTLQ
jgi:hypothetical protein